MMVVRGYSEIDGERLVLLYDPLPKGEGDEYTVPYAHYVESNKHVHWDDFYKISLTSTGGEDGGDISPGSEDEGPVAQALPAAKEAMLRFPGLLGLDAPGADEADLATGLAVVSIGLEDLRGSDDDHAPGRAGEEVFRKPAGEVIFPITVPDDQKRPQVLSGVVLRKSGNDDGDAPGMSEADWQPAAFGQTNRITALITTLNRHSEIKRLNKSDYKVLEVLGLNREFLMVAVEGELRFVPVRDDSEAGLLAGETLSSGELLNALRRIAASVDASAPS